MPETIHLDLITPERRLISTEVETMVAKNILGQFGILPGHANYVTVLEPGTLSFSENGHSHSLALSGGFAEVTLESGIRIMAETAEFADEIDLERARAAKARAEKRISGFDPAQQEIDIARAEAALKRALSRIEVAETLKS